MPKMRIAVVPKPGADFEIQEREIPTPGQDQVRIESTISENLLILRRSCKLNSEWHFLAIFAFFGAPG